MIGHFKRHYQKLQYGHKAILASVFIVGSLVSLFSSLFATNIPFQDDLPTIFSGMNFDTGNFSNAHFKYGGNDFAGIIFRLSGETLGTPQNITINGGSQSIDCSQHLRGIYYNNMRGWRLWPLDSNSLSILSGQGSGYDTLIMTGGFYTNCTGVSGYTPASNEIYGFMSHTRSGITMQMVAGVDYDFVNNILQSGSNFSPTFITTGGTYSGWIWDNYGGIAQIFSGQSLLDAAEMCDGFYVAPATIYTGINSSFTCSGHSISGYDLTGYILHIFSGNATVYTSTVYTSANSYTWTAGSGLPVGNYTAMCAILHDHGTGPQCGGNEALAVIASGSCSSNFQGDVTPANAYHFGGVMYYTSISGNTIQISATEAVSYSITGNFLSAPITGNYTGINFSNPVSRTIYLTQNNAWNYIYNTYGSGSCTYTGSWKQIYLDTLAPSVPALVMPITGTGICSTGSTTLSWTAVTDSGVGLSGYHYIIQHASGTVYSGLVASGTTGITLLTQNMLLGNYTLTVQAFDIVGNTSTSVSSAFVINPNYCTTGSYGTGIQVIGSLTSVTDANLDTVYPSETFYIRGLTGPMLASINLGTLIINGTGIGTTGMITSQDALRIELISSDQYDETVSSTLTVAGITGVFNVTTKANACNLSTDQEQVIAHVYELLRDQYTGNTNLLDDFLATFQSILGDEVDISEDCSLEYLLELINNDLDNTNVDTSNHIAPNCKEYHISYSNSEEAYFSPNMKNEYFFINRETLLRHIDFYNAGDCHINTYGNASWSENRNTDSIHVAPNGKIYHMQPANGGYTSSDFAGNKYFDNLSTMTNYIDSHNPSTNVWDHHVDTSFTPIIYLAANNKEYKIYRTNKGYMSYKLIKVRYFTTLIELENYINKNNPVK